MLSNKSSLTEAQFTSNVSFLLKFNKVQSTVQKELQPEMQNSQALQDISKEVGIYSNYLGQFGYQMFILRKCR